MMNELTGLECAIIGIAGVFPGADNAQTWWEGLCQSVTGLRPLTEEELITDNLNKDRVIRGGVLDNIYNFDADFFGYDNQSAELMDPQLRIAHREVWRALENANQLKHKDIAIGLFIGATSNRIWQNKASQYTQDNFAAQYHANTLNDSSFFATRIAYSLGLKGPAVTLNTACSSSLVCVHMAAQSLLSGDSDIAIAGATYLVPERSGYHYQAGMILSPDGNCRPFDQHSAGTVWGEGAGFVVLKRLDEAIADGDHIYAILKSSAINNDGYDKAGYTAPSLTGQTSVISRALDLAEITAKDISFIETHGTGTKLGDPIEVEALLNVYQREAPLLLGAVKANTGHLDVAAGITGLIKSVLSLYHRRQPPHPNFNDWSESLLPYSKKLMINKNTIDFPLHIPLYSAISSFGIGGTNVHAILTSYRRPISSIPIRRYDFFPFYFNCKEQLTQTSSLIELTLNRTKPSHERADLAYSLRKQYRQRVSSNTSVRQHTTGALITTLNENTVTNIHQVSQATCEVSPEVIFLFTGQGTQYRGMAKELYDHQPSFRRYLDTCFCLLQELGFNDPYHALFMQTSPVLELTEEVQPLLFSIEYSLARTLIDLNVKPTAMLGHSLGELVALCVAGAYTLTDALAIVIKRGITMSQAPNGAMIAIKSEYTLPPLNVECWVSANNSEQHTVIGGTQEGIEHYKQTCHNAGLSPYQLNNKHAFHTPQMQKVAKVFHDYLSATRFSVNHCHIPVISSVDGNWFSSELLTPGYWQKQMVQAVEFNSALSILCQRDSSIIFVEIGPGSGMLACARSCKNFDSKRHFTYQCLGGRKEVTPDDAIFTTALAQLYCAGINIDEDILFEGETRYPIPTPATPLNEKAYTAVARQGSTTKHLSIVSNMTVHDDTFLLTTKQQIATVWEAIFGSPPNSNSHFWLSGGNSMKALALAAELTKVLKQDVSFETVLDNPDFFVLSSLLTQTIKETRKTEQI